MKLGICTHVLTHTDVCVCMCVYIDIYIYKMCTSAELTVVCHDCCLLGFLFFSFIFTMFSIVIQSSLIETTSNHQHILIKIIYYIRIKACVCFYVQAHLHCLDLQVIFFSCLLERFIKFQNKKNVYKISSLILFGPNSYYWLFMLSIVTEINKGKCINVLKETKLLKPFSKWNLGLGVPKSFIHSNLHTAFLQINLAKGSEPPNSWKEEKKMLAVFLVFDCSVLIFV